MAEDYGWFNPHLALSVTWNGKRYVDFKATDSAWEKWRPHHPTSPHWYDEARLRRLMGAYIARDQDRGREPRTVREFVSEFRGLSGTAKQKLVLEEVGASRLSLPQFFGNGDRANNGRIAKLLAAMRRQLDQRDKFLRDVASHLADMPSDDAVVQAVNVVLDRRVRWR